MGVPQSVWPRGPFLAPHPLVFAWGSQTSWGLHRHTKVVTPEIPDPFFLRILGGLGEAMPYKNPANRTAPDTQSLLSKCNSSYNCPQHIHQSYGSF